MSERPSIEIVTASELSSLCEILVGGYDEFFSLMTAEGVPSGTYLQITQGGGARIRGVSDAIDDFRRDARARLNLSL